MTCLCFAGTVEAYDLPTDAILIASTSQYKNQAFIIGNFCLGLQFHPKAKKENIGLWLTGHAFEIESTPGISVSSLRTQTLLQMDTSQENGSY